MDFLPIKRALLSVTDKTGLPELARFRSAAGVELVSTGGTRKLLMEAGLPIATYARILFRCKEKEHIALLGRALPTLPGPITAKAIVCGDSQNAACTARSARAASLESIATEMLRSDAPCAIARMFTRARASASNRRAATPGARLRGPVRSGALRRHRSARRRLGGRGRPCPNSTGGRRLRG